MTKTNELNREYLLAWGSVQHYIKRMRQYHESRKTGEPLPTRWLHLAERSLVHRPILKYLEFLSASGLELPNLSDDLKSRIQSIDQQIDLLQKLLNKEGIIASLREPESKDLQTLENIYESVRDIMANRINVSTTQNYTGDELTGPL